MRETTDVNFARGQWFGGLPPDLRDEVLKSSTPLKIRTGRHVFRQGDPVRGLYGFVTGEGQVIGTTVSGQDVLVAVHRKGDWTGFLACIDGGPYTMSVVATEPCELLHLPLAAVHRIFFTDVDRLRLLVLPEMASTRSVYAHIVDHVTFTPAQRLARHLIDLTVGAYDKSVAVCFIAPVTQDQLATAILASRQWTNRLLRLFEAEGLIAVSRTRIDILDRPRLETLAIHGVDREPFAAAQSAAMRAAE